MTGRMRVHLGDGPFGPEWIVTCPEHGVVAWVQCDMPPGCLNHANAMNCAVWHVRNEHVHTCDACWGAGYYGGMRSFIEGRMVEDRHPCDKCAGTGSIVLMGERA